jgi:hypothetical protein
MFTNAVRIDGASGLRFILTVHTIQLKSMQIKYDEGGLKKGETILTLCDLFLTLSHKEKGPVIDYVLRTIFSTI